MASNKVWPVRAPVALAIAATFVLAVALEIGALREARLGVVYCAILVVESGLVVAASLWFFGETYTLREAMGGALILAGAVVLAA